jgi:hypothetical protein
LKSNVLKSQKIKRTSKRSSSSSKSGNENDKGSNEPDYDDDDDDDDEKSDKTRGRKAALYHASVNAYDTPKNVLINIVNLIIIMS